MHLQILVSSYRMVDGFGNVSFYVTLCNSLVSDHFVAQLKRRSTTSASKCIS